MGQRRTYTTRQQTARLAELDSQLAGLAAILATYEATFTPGGKVTGAIPDEVGNAWNATHSAVTALEFERARVESNPWIFTGAEAETARLVALNID